MRTHVLRISRTPLKCAQQGVVLCFVTNPSPATGPSKDQLQPVHNQSLSFTQASTTATGPISKPSGPQLWSSPNWLQSSSVAGFFLVLGLDFKTLANITALDARAVACKENWVITSPIVDYVPEPHIFDDQEHHPRAEGRFCLIHCFQWPQKYERDYAFSICIPRKDSILSLKIAWYTPTDNDFIIPTGSKFTVGTLW